MPPPATATWRCRRDWRCDGREPAHDPYTGELTGWEPAVPVGRKPDGLCAICTGRFRAALAGLPRMLAELNASVGADQTAPAFDPAPRGGTPAPPIPLKGHVEALRAVLTGETLAWADRVGDACDRGLWEQPGHRAAGPLEWPPGRLGGLPHDQRVLEAAALLNRRHPVLLNLPPEPTPLFTTGDHPADHHDPDTTRIAGVDRGRSGQAALAWADRDGVDAAVAFLELARRTEAVAGRTRVRERSAVGCTRCGHPTLVRWPGDETWRCENCPHRVREDDHDVLRAALLRSRPATPRHR